MKNRFPAQTHFIGLRVSEALEDLTDDCRRWMNQQYGCRSGHATPPHITVVPPFALPPEYSDADVFSAADRAAAQCRQDGILPFEAQVKGFGCFGERTLFAHVEANPAWQRLHAAVYRACAELLPGALPARKKEYVPHLTVANRDIPAGAMDKALRYFAALELDEAFTAQTLAVFVRNAQGQWEIGANIE